MLTFRVFADGAAATGDTNSVLTGSLNLHRELNQRDTLTVAIWSDPSNTNYALFKAGQRVTLKDTTRTFFAGRIETIREIKTLDQGAGTSGSTFWYELACVGHDKVLERFFATGAWTGQTAGFILRSLVNTKLAADGFIASSVVDGPTIPSYEVQTLKSIQDIFQDISQQTKYPFFVQYVDDTTRDVNYFDPATAPTIFSLTDGTACESIECFSDLNQFGAVYRNKQYVLTGSGPTDYVTAQDTAEQTARAALEGGSGIHEAVEPAIADGTIQHAQTLATALIRRYGKSVPGATREDVREIIFKVNNSREPTADDFRLGARINVILTSRNITGSYIISALTLTTRGNAGAINIWEARITRDEYQPGWEERFGPALGLIGIGSGAGETPEGYIEIAIDASGEAWPHLNLGVNQKIILNRDLVVFLRPIDDNLPEGEYTPGSRLVLHVFQDSVGGRTIYFDPAGYQGIEGFDLDDTPDTYSVIEFVADDNNKMILTGEPSTKIPI